MSAGEDDKNDDAGADTDDADTGFAAAAGDVAMWISFLLLVWWCYVWFCYCPWLLKLRIVLVI